MNASAFEIEVFQREYGFGLRSKGTRYVRTPRVETCTVWCGVDIKNKEGAGFLCHFDFPFTVNSLDQIIDELAAITPRKHLYKTYLCGGRPYTWSCKTRDRIHDHLSKNNKLNIEVEDMPFFKGFFGKGIKFDMAKNDIQKCSGTPKYRKGAKEWFDINGHIYSLSEMRKCKGSA